jgi:hypothetical protein
MLFSLLNQAYAIPERAFPVFGNATYQMAIKGPTVDIICLLKQYGHISKLTKYLDYLSINLLNKV